MSEQVASTLGPIDQDSSQLDEPVVDQQPSVEQPQQEEPPVEIQDITAGKEEVNVEDPVNRDEEKEKDASEDLDLETDLQELAVSKTGGEGGDGPDVREEFASIIEPVEVPEAEHLDENTTSRLLSHPSTNQARPCLASEIRRDRARSGWYGRRPDYFQVKGNHLFERR